MLEFLAPSALCALSVLALATPAPRSPAQEGAASASRPNVVLIVLDDVGVEKINAYGSSPRGVKPLCTPSIDALAREGLMFTQAWGAPVCSPARAQMLTGRHGFRTGIGGIIEHDGDQLGLSAALERTLPELLTGYESALVGKWHLAHPTRDGLRHPLECGFTSFAGSLFNIASPAQPLGPDQTPPACEASGPLGYRNWVKTSAEAATPGARQSCETRYATSVTTDDALARARTLRAPWFLEVGYNAAHLPAEKPPVELLPSEELCGKRYEHFAERADMMNAMVAALDTEVGRLVAGLRDIDPAVTVLLVSDNGTSIPAAQGHPNSCFARGRSKGTLYQGGVRVPLIAAGPGIAPGRCDALVGLVDVYATVAELAGVASTAEDSVSLVPYFRGERGARRNTLYTEMFAPNFTSPDHEGQPPFRPTTHARAIRDARFKLIRTTDAEGNSEEQLFDLQRDPCEEKDLLEGLRAQPLSERVAALGEEARTHHADLCAELEALGVLR
jgi:arylsulfatase A-like enzyme